MSSRDTLEQMIPDPLYATRVGEARRWLHYGNGVYNVFVRRIMIVEEHLDDYAEEAANLRHGSPRNAGKTSSGLFPVAFRYRASGHKST